MKHFVLGMSLLGLVSCVPDMELRPVDSPLSSNNFHLKLIDAPKKDISEVWVKIASVEVLLQKGGKEGRLVTNKDMGLIDLLKLQNGVSLALKDLKIPTGVKVSQIRFILEDNGHYLTRSNGDTCILRTPSQQRTGIKLLTQGRVSMEEGMDYTVVVDFDAMKSIVEIDQYDCLLKPVLKIASITKVEMEHTEEMEQEQEASEDAVAEESTTEEPAAEEPVVAEGSTTEEPAVAEETTAEEPAVVEEPATEEPVVAEQPTSEEPVAEQPASEEQVAQEDTTNNNDLGVEFDPYNPETWPADLTEEELSAYF